jgi:hypothetical protein
MQLDSINFWLNAFIPNSACIIKGDLFVVASPPEPLLPRFFTGDQREFSDDVNALARAHSEVRIEGLATDTPNIAFQNNVCGESHEVDSDGNIILSATASAERMFFANLRGSKSVDPDGGGVVDNGIAGSIQIDVVGSAGMPLIAIAPDIDYSGTLIIDRAEGNVLFRGKVSQFPAFEIYFRVNDGLPGPLAQLQPLVSLDLFGGENRPVDVSARILI